MTKAGLFIVRVVSTLAVLVSGSALAAQDTGCPIPDASRGKSDKIPLCLVAQKMAATLAEYNSDPDTAQNALPPLQKADFEFKTEVADTGGFKFTFLIFTFGSTHKSDTTNDVTFSYAVPAPKRPPNLSFHQYLDFLAKRPPPKDFSAELLKALKGAAEEVKTTRKFANADFKTLTLSMGYAVTWDTSASASIPIQLVTLGPSIDHTRADTQTVKLTFEAQPPAQIQKP